MKPCTINGRYTYILPDHLADWDALSMWERERTESMEAHLNGGMILYDIGSEHGAQSVVYSGFCGPENMVLIEPSPWFWSNLRLIWEHNHLKTPLATVQAFVSDRTVGDQPSVVYRAWPSCSLPQDERPARAYAYLHAPDPKQPPIPQWRLDQLVPKIGVVPDAITIDIEGAELLALRGARAILKIYRPLVWVSVHPDLMERDYGHSPADLHLYMADLDYEPTWLATDHEEHWLFTPKETDA